MIVIGSKSLYYGISDVNDVRYVQSDFDVIMSYGEFLKWYKDNDRFIVKLYPTSSNKYKARLVQNGVYKMYEIELDEEGSSSKFLLDNVEKVCKGELLGFVGETYNALSLEYLLLTKKSHLIYPVHFEKNIADYELLKTILGDFEKDVLMNEYFQLRRDEAQNRYKQRTPKLNVSTEDFFSSKLNVPHYFVHDDIHEVMAHNDEPIYKKMQPDSSSAWCAKDLFLQLSYDYQLQSVQEEAYVIALERYIIPQYGDNWSNYKESYLKALKRICTTLTSGWFREFAIENYNECVKRYDENFVLRFNEAVESGRIRKLEN